MDMTIAIIAAFTVIFAFLVGGYSMFRISEHYNRIFRRIIEERTEDRVARDLFELPKQPKPKTVKTKRPDEVKSDDA